jgi:hypothetical protein
VKFVIHNHPELSLGMSRATHPIRHLLWWRVLNLAKKNYFLICNFTNLVNYKIQKLEGLTSENSVYQNRNLPVF